MRSGFIFTWTVARDAMPARMLACPRLIGRT